MFSISKFIPIKQDLKADAVKFAQEKFCSADADLMGIAKYFKQAQQEEGKMLAGLAACVIKKRESSIVCELKKLAYHNKKKIKRREKAFMYEVKKEQLVHLNKENN